MVHSDSVLRQLLGIATEIGFERIEIGYQRIIDNLHLLDDATLLKITHLVMPKKGKPNKVENQEQQAPAFKKRINKHSAVESNINELEHCGLDRCPDRGFHGFKRYIAIAFVAYNLKRIGREILKQEQQALKKNIQKQRTKQAA